MRLDKELLTIKMSTLSQNIAERLVESILSGRLKAGSRLNESLLSRQLQVSRAPIREALNQLQEQGLVVHLPRRGMFVVSLNDEDIEKINRLRVVMESEALVHCRAHLTPLCEKKLLAQLEKMERASEASPLEAVRLDMAFHQLIWSQSGNEYLERALISLTAPQFAHFLIAKSLASQAVILKSHRPLVDFVQGHGRKESARRLMADHLALSWSHE